MAMSNDDCRALLAEASAALPAGFGDLSRRIDAYFESTAAGVECFECGQPVDVSWLYDEAVAVLRAEVQS